MKKVKDWFYIKFGEIAEFKNGLNYSAKENGYKIKFLGVGDFKDRSEISDMSSLKTISLSASPHIDFLLSDNEFSFRKIKWQQRACGQVCCSIS